MTNAEATPPTIELVTTASSMYENDKLKRIVDLLIKMDNEQRLIKEMTAEVSDDDYRDDLMV